MRQLSAHDLPWILAKLRAPSNVRRALGDTTLTPGIEYDEEIIFAGVPAEVANVSGVMPTPTVDSVNNFVMLQECPADAPTFQDINWTHQNYNNTGANNIVLTGNRARVVLIVQLIGTAPIAIGFGTQALYSTVNARVQGVVLDVQGGSLYIDQYCPTGNIYIDGSAAGSAFVVVQGTRAGPLSPPWQVSMNPGGP